jgi:hypothetical protein
MTGQLATAVADTNFASVHAVATSGYGAVVGISLGVGIPLVIAAAIAVIVSSYYRLQRHRADAVAMAAYRNLAEQAVEHQQELRTELAKLTERVQAVEQLMRDVG